jgi:hypothetical protein
MPTVGMGRVPATLGRQFGKMRRPASLGAKLVMIMTVVALCGTVAITVLLASIITPSFTKLEDAAISGQVERTRAMLSKYPRQGLRLVVAPRLRRDHSLPMALPKSQQTAVLPAQVGTDRRVRPRRNNGLICSIVRTSRTCLAGVVRRGSIRGWEIVSQR